MAVQVIPAWESPSFVTGDTRSVDVVYLVFGSEADPITDIEANGYLLSGSDETYDGLPKTSAKLSERRGDFLYVGTVTYSAPATEDDYEYEFDTTGGTTKITQSIATVNSYAASGTAPNFQGAIGVTKDGVEGCEIVAPAYAWQETYEFDNALLTESYRNGLAALTGTVCSGSFRGYPAGEVRFDGATGRRKNSSKTSVTFKFTQSPNASGLTIGSISSVAKKGWEYLWVLYEESSDENRLVKRPVAVYVEQVYKYVSWSGLTP